MTGIDLIKKWEQCRLTAYQDGGGVWTIGWGHTGPEVVEGLVWTQHQADDALDKDYDAANNGVFRRVLIRLTENQEAALTSFVFNLGESNFAKSKLLARVNESRHVEAMLELISWHHDNGKKVRGLLRRRLDEAALYLT